MSCVSLPSPSPSLPPSLSSCPPPFSPVLKDPDSNPFSLLEGEGELAGDTDTSDGGVPGDRRRRSRRRRNDQEPSVMDAAAIESDGQAGPNENGLGKKRAVLGSLWLVDVCFFCRTSIFKCQ